MQQRLDAVIGAASTEPGTWTGARVEDVVATLDGIAAMAAIEADRLRDLQDRTVDFGDSFGLTIW